MWLFVFNVFVIFNDELMTQNIHYNVGDWMIVNKELDEM
jgi:hypothetical protein